MISNINNEPRQCVLVPFIPTGVQSYGSGRVPQRMPESRDAGHAEAGFVRCTLRTIIVEAWEHANARRDDNLRDEIIPSVVGIHASGRGYESVLHSAAFPNETHA